MRIAIYSNPPLDPNIYCLSSTILVGWGIIIAEMLHKYVDPKAFLRVN